MQSLQMFSVLRRHDEFRVHDSYYVVIVNFRVFIRYYLVPFPISFDILTNLNIAILESYPLFVRFTLLTDLLGIVDSPGVKNRKRISMDTTHFFIIIIILGDRESQKKKKKKLKNHRPADMLIRDWNRLSRDTRRRYGGGGGKSRSITTDRSCKKKKNVRIPNFIADISEKKKK